tara:strand:- start:435 stop:884 length:450 start_codon:yes stop_codon:yes gene_type:complete
LKRKHKYLGLKRTLQVLLLIPLTNLASCGISGVVQNLHWSLSYDKHGFSDDFIEQRIKYSGCTVQEKEDYTKAILKAGHYTQAYCEPDEQGLEGDWECCVSRTILQAARVGSLGTWFGVLITSIFSVVYLPFYMYYVFFVFTLRKRVFV